jgi:phasin
MDQEQRDRFEIPQEMRSMAEAGFDQARKAFEHMLTSAQQTAATIEDRGAAARANAKEITGRAVGFAERNVHAALDYAQQLVHAKDLGEVMRLHTEYVQAQMKAFAEQASEFGQVVTKAAQDVAKPKV